MQPKVITDAKGQFAPSKADRKTWARHVPIGTNDLRPRLEAHSSIRTAQVPWEAWSRRSRMQITAPSPFRFSLAEEESALDSGNAHERSFSVPKGHFP